MFLDGEEDLVGVDRFDKVIRDLAAEGFVHDVFLLALGDHYHWQLGSQSLDLSEGVESTDSRHVFIKEDEVKFFFGKLVECFGT